MARTTKNPLQVADEGQLPEETLMERFIDWVRTELVWYAGSFSLHLLALSALLLLPNLGGGQNQDDTTVLVSQAQEEPQKEPTERIDPFEIGPPDETQPQVLDITPPPKPPTPDTQTAKNDGGIPGVEAASSGGRDGVKDAGFGGGVLPLGPGPKVTGLGNIGIGPGKGPGVGDGTLTGRIERRKQIVVPKRSERAVNAALVWLANHQLPDGSWSLQHYTERCTDKTCSGTGEISADAGATAMGLLPFLAAGQTHKAKGPYKEHVRKGLAWLILHQQPDGNLAKGAAQMMYSHGLATIALCEAYGLTGDKEVGRAAQGAVNFILNAQNAADGGWRYNPRDPGDTSVVGWQLMALKSASLAGLAVGGSAFSGTSKWLDSVAVHDGTEYAYQPGQGPSATMTSVGLLCRQYLGAKRDNPMLTGGMSYLLKHLPDEEFPNIYYWYYATQVMHNMYGTEWDTWNHKMRELLVHTQVRDVYECANGSWAPQKDAWGSRGGRLMQTSLSALTLEVYYRYLPLFKEDARE